MSTNLKLYVPSLFGLYPMTTYVSDISFPYLHKFCAAGNDFNPLFCNLSIKITRRFTVYIKYSQ
jgi:hypothetical protein